MNLVYRRDISFRVAAFFLKVVGFWFAATRVGEWFRNATIVYSFVATLFTLWLQLRGLYFAWGDISACSYAACNTVGVGIELFKVCVLSMRRKKFLYLIGTMQGSFGHLNYDKYEESVLMSTRRVCFWFVCGFSFLNQSTTFFFVISPILSNYGRNDSDRRLIFEMFLDWPLTVSPYFEIVYLAQAFCLYQSAVCYLCFDNMFSIMCLHVAGQFRILQHRLETMLHVESGQRIDNDNERRHSLSTSSECYVALKSCIRQHQDLIDFFVGLEELFRVIILGQVLMFSVGICLAGYQVFLAKISFSWRITFASYASATVYQLWMFTYSCDCVARESVNVATSVYGSLWTQMPMNKPGRFIRKDLQLIVMRSRRACCLTACGFFPISQETYTKIMSTAMSYFTLLKQRVTDETNE